MKKSLNFIYAIENKEDILSKIDNLVLQNNVSEKKQSYYDELRNKFRCIPSLDDLLKKYITKEDSKIVIYCDSTDQIKLLENIIKTNFKYLNENIDTYTFSADNDDLMNDYQKWKFLYSNNRNLKLLFVSLPIDLEVGLSDIETFIIYSSSELTETIYKDLILYSKKCKSNSRVVLDVIDGKNISLDDFFEEYHNIRKDANKLKKHYGIISEQNESIDNLENFYFKLVSTWEWWYELLEKYYNHYKNIEVPSNFKTKNGYEYDEFGYYLGKWLSNQRNVLKKDNLNVKQKKRKILLEKLGMRFENKNKILEQDKRLQLLKAYYDEYQNLDMPYSFKTKDGVHFDDNGFNMGAWLNKLIKKLSNKKRLTNVEKEQKDFLIKLGVKFIPKTKLKKLNWNGWYNLAKAYYEHYNNLDVPKSFKTINGYDYEENGYNLSNWLANQNIRLNNQNLNKKEKLQRKKLENIGFKFYIPNKNITFDKVYNLLEKYYNHYHNLDIDPEFKTKDGVNFDETGYNLSKLLIAQIKNISRGEISSKKIIKKEKLEALGVKFEKKKVNIWKRNYRLLSNYYNYYGNLDIPQAFKTKDGITYNEDGIELGKWANYQLTNLSRIFLSKEEKERKQKLEIIGMDFSRNEPKIFERIGENNLNAKIKYLKSIYKELENIETNDKNSFMKK